MFWIKVLKILGHGRGVGIEIPKGKKIGQKQLKIMDILIHTKNRIIHNEMSIKLHIMVFL